MTREEAIKAEPCEDTVSAVIHILTELGYGDEENGADAEYMSALCDVAKKVKALSSVTSKSMECKDAISRQAVLDGVDRYIYKSQSTGTQDDFYSFAELVVKALPPVTPKLRTGKWNDYYTSQKGNDVFNCKLCGATFVVTQGKDDMNFCPNCGAKMDAKKGGESE